MYVLVLDLRVRRILVVVAVVVVIVVRAQHWGFGNSFQVRMRACSRFRGCREAHSVERVNDFN